MSWADAEQLPALPGLVVISITAPEKLGAALADFERILRLSFPDLYFLSKNISSKASKRPQKAFTRDQAVAVKAFVESLPSETHAIVVHCEGGGASPERAAAQRGLGVRAPGEIMPR